MADDATIQVAIDPSLLEHVRGQLARKRYPIAPAGGDHQPRVNPPRALALSHPGKADRKTRGTHHVSHPILFPTDLRVTVPLPAHGALSLYRRRRRVWSGPFSPRHGVRRCPRLLIPSISLLRCHGKPKARVRCATFLTYLLDATPQHAGGNGKSCPSTVSVDKSGDTMPS